VGFVTGVTAATGVPREGAAAAAGFATGLARGEVAAPAAPAKMKRVARTSDCSL
jgi:hypothetical protein